VISRSKESIERFMGEIDMRLETIDLVIPSQYPSGFLEEIGKMAGIGIEKVISLPKNYGRLYTTGPGFALRWAQKNGYWDRSKNILFLGVGPGIKVSLGYYRNAGSQ
jgi:3-oxoacyl-[acyl-carrier-protein] synthase III